MNENAMWAAVDLVSSEAIAKDHDEALDINADFDAGCVCGIGYWFCGNCEGPDPHQY